MNTYHADDRAIAHELDDADGHGRVIGHAAARTIVAQVQDPATPMLAAFAAAGTITDLDVLHAEILHVRGLFRPGTLYYEAMEALDIYVTRHGTRPPFPGWSALWLNPPAKRRTRAVGRGRPAIHLHPQTD